MFTGIVEELGEVVVLERLGDSARVTVRGERVMADASPGDSIAVNGICLTVAATSGREFTADVTGETLKLSGIGALVPGEKINLERAVRPHGRLGGHIVQGHTDGTGTVLSRRHCPNWDVVRVAIPPDLSRYVVHKGSVAIDGTSLTVSGVTADGGQSWLEVSLIPETLKRTTLGIKQPGEAVNLEVDVIAKYREAAWLQVAATPRGHDAGQSGDTRLDSVEQAIADIAAGRAVVVVDDLDRENEGDIIFAASKATPELLAFMIRYTSGVICVPMLGEDLDRLHLPLMMTQNSERNRTAFTVTVDARTGVTTGISATDRARTARALADPATEPGDLVRPGHIFPLRYAAGGVLRRPGHTEAAVDLARLAGLPPAGVIAEVTNDNGTMARRPDLRQFADAHGLALISIAQLIEYRRRTELVVRRIVEARVPNQFGPWRAVGYLNWVDETEHVALVLGEPRDGMLVRIHSECLTGDVFGSVRCDCGAQLSAAMATIAADGGGSVIYMRGHEGRGIGLLSKLCAYQLQDGGADTVDANLELGMPADARDYSTGAQMLADLGVRSVRLLTNNPDKARELSEFGIDVTGRVALQVDPTADNLRYLTTKRDRLGHELDNLAIPNGDLPPAALRPVDATAAAKGMP
jgi:3,4-dihydroxy 2-butanone 4-phosphate synthase / GTP cyclohydrolase II